MDIAIVGAALAVDLAGSRVRKARVALCAVAPTPLRVRAAEAALVEAGLTETAIAAAAELARTAARPISEVRATAEYRREVVGVLVRRGLERIRDGDPGPGGS